MWFQQVVETDDAPAGDDMQGQLLEVELAPASQQQVSTDRISVWGALSAIARRHRVLGICFSTRCFQFALLMGLCFRYSLGCQIVCRAREAHDGNR